MKQIPTLASEPYFGAPVSHRLHNGADVTPLGASARAHGGIELAEARDRIRG